MFFRQSQSRLKWFGHVQRRNCDYIRRKMLRLDLLGRSSGGSPKRRYMDVVRLLHISDIASAYLYSPVKITHWAHKLVIKINA